MTIRFVSSVGISRSSVYYKPRLAFDEAVLKNSQHEFPRYQNRVEDLKIRRPDQVWVAEITYIRLRDESIYLAVLMDVFTRMIRGWHLGRNLDQGLTLGALERALVVATPKIHHSGQGVQYAATADVNRLKNSA